MPLAIRPLEPRDHTGLNALHRSVCWPERSAAGWRWLDENPARQEIQAPSGWVIEGIDGQPAACVGNFIQRFWVDDVVLHGATGFSIIVPPAVRGQSRALLRAFIDQPDMAVRYTFNANSRSCGLYHRYGLQAWPPRTHALKLSWVIDAGACLHSRILRALNARLPNLTPRSEQLTNRRLESRPRLDCAPGVAVLTDLNDVSRYAAFWDALRGEGAMVADRSPAMLRWRLSDPDLTTRPLLLAFNRGRAITGYAIAMLGKGSPIEPPFLEILDLVALGDEPEAIPALMKTLIGAARPMGAAKLRMQTVSPAMLERLGPFAARARREGGWGHCHVQFAPEWRETAQAGWSPTPFDGDYSFCTRPVPLAAETRIGRRVHSKDKSVSAA